MALTEYREVLAGNRARAQAEASAATEFGKGLFSQTVDLLGRDSAERRVDLGGMIVVVALLPITLAFAVAQKTTLLDMGTNKILEAEVKNGYPSKMIISCDHGDPRKAERVHI